MRLLVVTQIVDTNDPVLGFFHNWLISLAPRFEQITVICLKKGLCELPGNVTVYSLGKEHGKESRAVYAVRFLKIAWKLRKKYDAVFVHMNQEYILIAGWFWKLWHKKIYMWRNHYAGTIFTDIAAAFCTKVFCTSRYSYTAKYKKTVLMPVGIDMTIFSSNSSVPRKPNSILFLARIAPSKHAEILIQALNLLQKRGVEFSASIYGDALPEHAAYKESLEKSVSELGLSDQVVFHNGISNTETPNVYRAHEIFVNCSQSGMFDKTIFEAAACGCRVLASSKDFATLAGEDHYFELTPESLAEKLRTTLALLLSITDRRISAGHTEEKLAAAQSLPVLTDKLAQEVAS